MSNSWANKPSEPRSPRGQETSRSSPNANDGQLIDLEEPTSPRSQKDADTLRQSQAKTIETWQNQTGQEKKKQKLRQNAAASKRAIENWKKISAYDLAQIKTKADPNYNTLVSRRKAELNKINSKKKIAFDPKKARLDAICRTNPEIGKMAKDFEEEEKPKWYENPDTPHGKLLDKFFIDPNLRSGKKKVERCMEQSVNILDSLTEQISYPKAALEAHEIYSITVFLASLIVALWDIIVGYEFLAFKYTAIILSVIDFVVAVLSLDKIAERYPCYKNNPKAKRNHLLAQNIISEVLIYPLILLMVIGTAVGQAWYFDSVLNGSSFVLAVAGLVDLLWTYSERIIILHSFTKGLQEKLNSSMKGTAGYILTRFVIAVIGNTVLFMFMISMIFMQVLADNFETQDYTISTYAAYLMGTALLIPIMSVITFILANLHFFKEFLLSITLLSTNQDDLINEVEESSSETMSKSLSVFMSKMDSAGPLMESYIAAKWYKKLTTPLTSWYTYVILLMWSTLVAGQIMIVLVVSREKPLPTLDWAILISFCALAMLINCQAVLLLVVSPLFGLLYLIVLLIGACINACKSKKEVSGDSNSLSSEEREVKSPGLGSISQVHFVDSQARLEDLSENELE